MRLDRAFASAELIGDLLVERTGSDQGEDLAFASGKRLVTLAEVNHFVELLKRFTIQIDAFFHSVNQVLVTQRLGKKADRATLHRFDRHGDIAMSGDENDGKTATSFGQFTLKIQSTQARHLHIQHQASWSIRHWSGQELLGRREHDRFQRNRSQQARQKGAKGRIVIDDYYYGRFVGHYSSLPRAGSVNLKVAPGPLLGSAQRLPPWASIIDRLMASPIPMPPDFVVWNALKTCSSLFGSIPIPQSDTATTTPSLTRSVLTTNSAVLPSIPFIASMPFITRLSSTCSN